ncbi:sensor histidine kinase [Streptosporangium sp. NPDC051023]|uniref:sensor histidine kinase n=1 Tax=Streptosporangium sp. NPDC051023 TaxID=3155410 RepID=UPI00344F666F
MTSSPVGLTTGLRALRGRRGPLALARPVPWVSFTLYLAVLAGGVYYDMVGAGDRESIYMVGFVGGLVSLLVLDVAERRRFGTRPPAGPAIALLAARLGLFAAVSAFDGSGLSRALFLLVPFTAYFAFGRRTGIALGMACLGLLAAALTLSVPGWYTRAEYISDLLMFALGLVLVVATAEVAVGEQAGRVRLERTLRELEESHGLLTAYAGQVAELSTAMERTRVARDIHDSLGHHLTAISIQLEKASAFRDLDRAAADRALTDARWSARRALEEVRQAVRALRAGTRPFSLSEALAELVGHAGDGRLAVTLDLVGQEDGYGAESLAALYRATQECLTNARRHGDAEHVSISVTFGESVARLVVTDDGKGFSPSTRREGFGLLGIRERTRLLGGGLDIRSGRGVGTVITVTVPRTAGAASRTAQAAG